MDAKKGILKIYSTLLECKAKEDIAKRTKHQWNAIIMSPLKPLLGLSTNSGSTKKTPDHKVAARTNKKRKIFSSKLAS